MYLLRAKQLGFTMADLEELSEALVIDALTESSNDHEGEYQEVASQHDFDAF